MNFVYELCQHQISVEQICFVFVFYVTEKNNSLLLGNCVILSADIAMKLSKKEL